MNESTNTYCHFSCKSFFVQTCGEIYKWEVTVPTNYWPKVFHAFSIIIYWLVSVFYGFGRSNVKFVSLKTTTSHLKAYIPCYFARQWSVFVKKLSCTDNRFHAPNKLVHTCRSKAVSCTSPRRRTGTLCAQLNAPGELQITHIVAPNMILPLYETLLTIYRCRNLIPFSIVSVSPIRWVSLENRHHEVVVHSVKVFCSEKAYCFS